jgi:hypothetical protein
MTASIPLLGVEAVMFNKYVVCEAPNGVRYPRVGGTRQRCFGGTNLKPRKQLENAASPTRRVHAVLGGIWKEYAPIEFIFI